MPTSKKKWISKEALKKIGKFAVDIMPWLVRLAIGLFSKK
jgi:hypothetical protein